MKFGFRTKVAAVALMAAMSVARFGPASDFGRAPLDEGPRRAVAAWQVQNPDRDRTERRAVGQEAPARAAVANQLAAAQNRMPSAIWMQTLATESRAALAQTQTPATQAAPVQTVRMAPLIVDDGARDMARYPTAVRASFRGQRVEIRIRRQRWVLRMHFTRRGLRLRMHRLMRKRQWHKHRRMYCQSAGKLEAGRSARNRVSLNATIRDNRQSWRREERRKLAAARLEKQQQQMERRSIASARPGPVKPHAETVKAPPA